MTRSRHTPPLAFIMTIAVTTLCAHGSDVLPQPTGPHAIGTVQFDWTDSQRADPFPKGKDRFRRLAVRLWYPAKKQRSETMPYLQEPDYWVEVYGPQMRSINQQVVTHAMADASTIDGASLPVIVFSPGANQPRQFYQSLVEDWASHGFVVAAIAHPHANRDVYANGQHIQAHRAWSPPQQLRTIDADAALYEFWDPMIEVLAQDQRFVIDQLTQMNAGNIPGPLAGRLALSQVIVAGHSRGAKAAFRCARTDPRIGGCIAMDDPPPPPERSGLPVSVLALTRGQPDPSLERFTQALFQNTRSPMFWAALKNTSHMSFSDIPLIAPQEFGITPEVAQDNMRTIRSTTRAFLSYCTDKKIGDALDPDRVSAGVDLRVTGLP